MAAQIFPYGTALTVVWHLSKPDGTDFDITGYTYRVYYRTGNKETEANGSHVTASGNTISIVIPATEPSAPGEYALRLVLYQNNKLFCTLNYNGAFVLSRRLAQDLAVETQQEEVQVVHLYTVAEFYLFTPIIPTVGSDGYWYVNGTKVTDGQGEYVPSSHTMEYDAVTNYIIIDRGRVDSQGHSIAQTITSLADALSIAAEDHNTAQEDHSTAADDHETATADHTTATWDHQAIVDMIDLYEPITINGDVTNAPDEEDITSDENDLLKFKDRGVIYGMGYCILRRNKTFAEQLTKTNTIYEIRYDFDLDGATVTVPEGCILKFVGGSLANGVLQGNGTRFLDCSSGCMEGISLSGSFAGEEAHIGWFNASGDDISSNMQILVNGFNTVIVDKGTFYITDTVILRSGVTIKGEDRKQSVIKASVDRYEENDMLYTMFSTAEVEIPWNVDPVRRGNLDNTNDEILYSDIIIENLSFDLNRHAADFPNDEMRYAYCTCVYFLDTKDSSISNCDFVDYQPSGIAGEYKNNSSSACVFYNSSFCRVSYCYSKQCGFVFLQKGTNNEVCFNTGEKSVNTWVETLTSHHVYIHDNRLESIYWLSSMMSTNGKYGVVENNIIIEEENVYHPGGFTFGHSPDAADASFGVFRHNYVKIYNGSGVLVQNSENVDIFDNYIYVTTAPDPSDPSKSEESWSNWRSEAHAGVRFLAGKQKNSRIENNMIYHGRYNGIYYNIANDKNSNLTIKGNNIYGYINGINVVGGLSSLVVIDNNELDAKYMALYETTQYEAVKVVNNIIKNQLFGGTNVENNVFDFLNKTINTDYNFICNLPFSNFHCFKHNTFKNVSVELQALTRFTFNIFEIKDFNYTLFAHNTYAASYADKSVFSYFNDGGWKSIYVKDAILSGKGDYTQTSLSAYEAGAQMYDTTLQKYVLWNGAAWTNLDGTALA